MRSVRSILLTLALVASLVAGALPAVAATTPTALPTYSACPPGYVPTASFNDVKAGSTHASDIACVKYYGVTKGTTATTYSPTQAVTREQMALFLVRAAGPAGITVPASPANPGFTDIAGLPAESQLAIKQLVALGITKGTSATTFSPAANVTREQMALFLTRLLDKAVAGPGGTQPKSINPVFHDFTDIAGLPTESYLAVIDLFHLGVTTGTSATKYSPYAAVTREQMASFIARTLSHSNARPAGLVLQTSLTSGTGTLAPVLSITYRSSGFSPVSGVPVDVFEYVSATGTAAFNADGTCKDVVASGTNSSACVIANADPATNSLGNLSVTESVAAGATVTFYAWTAAVGTVFDRDVQDEKSVTVTSSKTATTLKVTSTADAATTKDRTVGDTGYHIVTYGTPVTITAQLTDGTNNVSTADVEITFQHQRLDKTGSIVFIQTSVVKTGSTGAALFTINASDPTGGDDVTWDTVTVTRTGLAGSPATVKVAWEDEAAVATTVSLTQASSYSTASSHANGVKHTVTATVKDQFGSPMWNVPVTFTSNDSEGIGALPVIRYTGTDGKVSLEYRRDSDATGAEVITATITGASAIVTHYWVSAGSAGTYNNTAPASTQVVLVNTAADLVVVLYDNNTGDATPASYLTLTWDSGDQFNAPGAVSQSAFETALAAKTLPSTSLSVTYIPGGISVWTLS